MRYIKHIARSTAVILFSLIVIGLIPVAANAQGFIVDWSNPEVLFSTPEGQKSNEVWVLRDQTDNLYLWWPIFDASTEVEPINRSIDGTLHTQRVKGEWRSPKDVMVWPDAGRLTSVVIDQEGLLHAFSATDCVSYVSAQHDQAMSAQAWGDRSCLDQAGLANPTVVRAEDGTIYVLYAALGNHSFRLIHSKDNGVTWSSYVTAAEDPDDFLQDPMMAIDNQGRLHAVWSVGSAPDGYPPIGVYYSRSDNNGVSWSVPFQLGGIDEGQPAITVYEDDVHVLWNGDAEKRGRYYRHSKDAGETWESVVILSPPSSQGGRGGLQRPPAIIVDNLGNVHALLHEQESLFYTSKIDDNWTPKQPLYIPSMLRAREIFAVRLAITGGNQLHAIYILASNYQLNTGDIWTLFHQSRKIDAVSVSPTLWPTPTSEAAISLTQEEESSAETATLVPNAVEYTNPNNEDENSLNEYNPSSGFFVGSITAISFIGFVFILYSVSRIRYNR